jgi:hypothetical protein
MARARGSRAQMALAFEGTFGTAPGSGYLQLPFASSGLGAAQGLIASELLGYGREPIDPTLDVVEGDGDISVPIDTAAWGVWLKLALGAPVTTGTGPYTHTFASGSLLSLPSASIEVGMPDVPRFNMNKGCKVNSINWNMTRGAGENLTATVSLISRDEVGAASTAAGTPTPFAFKRFGHWNGAIKKGGSTLGNVVSVDLTYSNNLEAIPTIGDGDGLVDAVDEGMASLTGSLTMRFASAAIIDEAVAGTPSAMEFSYTLATGESFTVTVPRVFFPRPKGAQIDGPDGVEVTYEFQAAQQTDGNPMMTAVLVNSVETY